jgi:hypothetical protein
MLTSICVSGCSSDGGYPVEIHVNGGRVFGSQLSPDRLLLDQQLGIGGLSQPPNTLTAPVDSPSRNHELLFFPFDAAESWESIVDCKPYTGTNDCSVPRPTAPTAIAGGFIHDGGAREYGVGTLFNLLNEPPQSIRSLYMRRHGECESAVPWQDLLDAVVSEIKGESGCGDSFLGCFDFETSFSRRIAISYLRQVPSLAAGIDSGRGGFGLHIEGDTTFDSPFLCDLKFVGKAGYDAVLSSQGLPVFEVATGPQVRAFDCSLSPFCSCQYSEVRDGVKDSLKDKVRKGLNETFEECLAIPAFNLGPATCTEPADCSNGATATILGIYAAQQAEARGADLPRREAFRTAMQDPNNWTCAPVKQECAALTGADATEDSVCQLKLRARNIVPMPDSVSLVWYEGGLGGQPPTAAEALYLALTQSNQADNLARLCTDPSFTGPSGTTRLTARAFVKVSK